MSSRSALFVVLATVVAFFAPVLLRGEVIFAHDNDVEVGAPAERGEPRLSNRKFADQSSAYVPEIHHHLRGDRAGWISTWNPHVELGRPTWQALAFGKGWILTHALSWVWGDAFAVYTASTVIAVALCALFGFLFLRALDLHPAACAAGSLALALGVFVAYWLTFSMFVWGVCWTLALLWLARRFVERPSLARGLGIAFAVHGLFLTAYPQQIVWHAYLLAWIVAIELLRRPGARRAKLATAAGLGAAVAVGLASVAPIYADLALAASRSARLEVDAAFFLRSLPALETPRQAARFVAQLFDASWFGVPIRSDYPLPFNGLCWTPLGCTLVALSFARGGWRRLWPWHAFLAVTLLLTVWPGAYLFAVEHLGLALSRYVPLAAGTIPAAVLAASAADRWLCEQSPRRVAALALACLPAALAAAAFVVAESPLDLGLVLAGGVIALGSLAFAWRPSAAWLVALAVASSFHWGFRSLLARPESAIRTSSELVERVREATADGSRFAWVGRGHGGALPANQEALLGLASVHSYDSLSARIYQDWTREVSARGAEIAGRIFASIADSSRLGGDALGFAGIGLLLSAEPIDSAVAAPLGQVGRIGLYRPRVPPRREALATRFALDGLGGARIAGALGDAGLLAVERTIDHDDLLELELASSDEPTLLFLSQQFHPQWRASSGGHRLETLLVNGFYQGVRVPPHTPRVRLEFRPWSRWSWVPQAFFVLAGAIVAALAASRRRSAR